MVVSCLLRLVREKRSTYPVGEAVGCEVAHLVDGEFCFGGWFVVDKEYGWMDGGVVWLLVARHRCFGQMASVMLVSSFTCLVMARDSHLEGSEWEHCLFLCFTC
jgi:hypothetical protein